MAKKKVESIKVGGMKCKTCDGYAEESPPCCYCTKCRLEHAEKTRIEYNWWKLSKGLPVESKEEELERIKKEVA